MKDIEKLLDTIELTSDQAEALRTFIKQYLHEWNRKHLEAAALRVAREFLRHMSESEKLFELKEQRIEDITSYLRNDHEFHEKYKILF